MTPQQRAFLDTIAVSEIGTALLKLSDNGYNVVVGSTPRKPILFTDYSKHPRIRNADLNSDAAGRYQFMGRYWHYYRLLLMLPDFGAQSQDIWALHLVKECRALEDIEAGRIPAALSKCASRWASLPGAGYGQHENDLKALLDTFVIAGGYLTTAS